MASRILHCTTCKKPFTNADSLVQHQQIHQVGGKRKLEKPNAPSPKKLRKDVKQYYTLKKISQTNIPKFRTTQQSYKVNVNNVEVRNVQNSLESLKIIFNSILQDITKFAAQDDLIRFSVQSPELDYPIALPFQRQQNLSAESFLSQLERVLQSFEEFVLNDKFEIKLIHVVNPHGGVGINTVNLDEFLHRKRSIIQIKNKDNLCCARAIVTAKAKVDGDSR